MIKKFNQFNESIRDKMTPKSNKFIDYTWEKIFKELIDYAKGWGDLDTEESIKIIENKKDLIFHMFSDGYSLDLIYHSIVFPDFNDGELRTFERNKTRLELKEEQQKKDEKRYLSQKERDRLTDAQRKYLVNKRKEEGSWNDADLKNNEQ